MKITRIAIPVFLIFILYIVSLGLFSTTVSASGPSCESGTYAYYTWEVCVPNGETIGPDGSVTITVSVTDSSYHGFSDTFEANVGLSAVYYGCIPTCMHTFTYPTDWGVSGPLSPGTYRACGQAAGIGAGVCGSFIVSDLIPTPEFPLGTLLAIIAPLGALFLYAYARLKLNSTPRMP